MLLQYAQGQRCVEAALGVVLQDGRALGPLAEELTKCHLGPAGVGDSPVQVGGTQVLPQTGGCSVGDGIGGLGVENHLGVANGARRKVDQHRIVAAGTLDVVEPWGCGGDLPVPHYPTAPLTVGDDEVLERRAGSRCFFRLVGVLGVGDQGDGFGLVHPVFDVPWGAESGGRHGHYTKLDHSQDGDVPLGNAWEHDQHPVALAHAQPSEYVGEPVGGDLQFPEGVLLGLLAIGAYGNESQLGAVLGPAVHYIQTEVEVLRHVQAEVAPCSLVVLHIGRQLLHDMPSFCLERDGIVVGNGSRMVL